MIIYRCGLFVRKRADKFLANARVCFRFALQKIRKFREVVRRDPPLTEICEIRGYAPRISHCSAFGAVSSVNKERREDASSERKAFA